MICESVYHAVVPGSATHGLQVFSLLCPRILQARTLEWAAIPFSRVPSPPRDRAQVSCNASRFFTAVSTREVGVSLHFLDTVIFSDVHTAIIVSHTVNSLLMYLSFLILRSSLLDLFSFLKYILYVVLC